MEFRGTLRKTPDVVCSIEDPSRKGSMGVLQREQDRSSDRSPLNCRPAVGPSLSPELSTTASDVLGMLQGKTKSFQWYGRMGYVHIDDVAQCHILVYEHKKAHGRQLCSSIVLDNNELVSMLSARYLNFPIPKRFEALDKPYYELNTSKLTSLGFKFKSIEEMFDDCIASLTAQGHLRSP